MHNICFYPQVPQTLISPLLARLPPSLASFLVLGDVDHVGIPTPRHVMFAENGNLLVQRPIDKTTR